MTFTVSDGQLTDSEIVTITVSGSQPAAVLALIGPKSVAEQTPLQLSVTARDPDLPPNTLTLTAREPAGRGDASTRPRGTFTWTPGEAQGPGSYPVTFTVSDGSLANAQTITITVAEVNVPPTLTPIGPKSVNELASLTFTVSATAPDLPANTLAYSATGLPPGASFNTTTRSSRRRPLKPKGRAATP